ncbi:MAG: hypothetical protein WAN03_13385 [Candidatus Sulfotelmatobacter sp.]
MRRRASGPTAVFLLALSIFWTGCGTTSRTVCAGSSNSTCGCGAPSSACPADFIPLLYATTTSNQILGFSINSSGALTALPSTTGPANSESVAIDGGNTLLFADTSKNSVDSVAVDLITGAVTSIQGSPFSLGTPGGGPTGIAVGGQYGYLYATEPNGTIVGLSSSSGIGTFSSPLQNSPFPAGVAPSQIAIAAQGNAGAFFLYASDPGDANGSILAYSADSSGSLSPIQGSPFPTLPNANPSVVLYDPYLPSSETQGTPFLLVSLGAVAKVAVFAIDSSTGALTRVPGSPFDVGDGPSSLATDQSNHVFVMNAVDHTVSSFNLGSNGVLTAIGSPLSVGTASGGIAFGSSLAVFDSSSPVYELFVADTAASAIWTLDVDQTTGELTQSGSPLMVSSPPLQLTFVDGLYPSQ